MFESTAVQLILIGIAIFAVLFFTWPRFRQMIGIKGNKAVDGMTTALEKEKHIYEGLVRQIKQNKIRVSNITGDYRHEVNELSAKKEAAAQAEADYNLAVDQNMPEAVQNEKWSDFEAANGAVEAQQGVVEQFEEAEKAAKKALEDSVASLKRLETQIQSDEAKAELKEVYEGAAEVLEAADAVDSAFSEVKQASSQIDRELERAKARMQGAQGSDADREFERLAEQARTKKDRAAYDAARKAAAGGDSE